MVMLGKLRKKQEAVVGILAFEVASVMSKLVHIWKLVSHNKVHRLRKHISATVGIKQLVSHDDDDFIQGSISGELFENMIPLTEFVARLGKNHCSDPCLKDFEHAVSDWINKGIDPFEWELPKEEMLKEANKMECFILVNADLYDVMKQLSDLEHTLKDITATLDGPILLEFQNKVELKRREVEYLKEGSLWHMTVDDVGLLLARSVFTVFSCIKSVFGVPQPMMAKDSDHTSPAPSIFSKYKLLDAPPGTLGAAALELQYANIVIILEHLVRCQAVLAIRAARDELYAMLPANMRADLSEMLSSIRSSTASTSSLADVAAEKNAAMAKTIDWLAPLAHNTKKWHSKRSRQQKACVSNSHVLLAQTLYYANQQKTEATIMELIVGLQYRRESKVRAIRESNALWSRSRSRSCANAASLEDEDKGNHVSLGLQISQ